ncbi:uncharacterized protein EMH_0066810 [Eimeria mitis]|uniref:Uncharacterized protein n=1 Tax=Eimeria mitis TaxID=44415 RepID=U6K191_9EIME|nr:uncharacterized protein EMH_0066810 [Eimeria mitis]CDJ31439.1 hypothetical protein EMH_0066810 [Eimeria mitis]
MLPLGNRWSKSGLSENERRSGGAAIQYQSPWMYARATMKEISHPSLMPASLEEDGAAVEQDRMAEMLSVLYVAERNISSTPQEQFQQQKSQQVQPTSAWR